jgi:serine/threonine protein kinase
MELLGKSLTILRKEYYPSRRFSVCTALRVGEQCIDALEVIHKIGYLHRFNFRIIGFKFQYFRDIKPSNLCIGLNNFGLQKRVYVIDFGMTRKYIQPDGELRSERSRAAFRGTTRYVSLAVHERREAVSLPKNLLIMISIDF